MILSYKDYLYYLSQDSVALGRDYRGLISKFREFLIPDYIFRFQRVLRRLEYIRNCKSGILSKIEFLIFYRYFNSLSTKLGFSIPLNVFGPGLSIVHYGTIVVNANARIGANCRIHPSTCIGASGGTADAPIIGDNVYIAPGVKIYGAIRLANNIATAANAAVATSFEEENILIGGVPAIKIKNFDIKVIIKHIS